MAYYKGQKCGQLRIILQRYEKMKITEFHRIMEAQCKELGITPVTISELVKMAWGDRPNRTVRTYLIVVNALNTSRRVRQEPYTLYDIIEVDEILKPKRNG